MSYEHRVTSLLRPPDLRYTVEVLSSYGNRKVTLLRNDCYPRVLGFVE